MNQERMDPWPIRAKEIRYRLDDVINHLGLIEQKLCEHPLWGEDKKAIQRITQELINIKRDLCIPVDYPVD